MEPERWRQIDELLEQALEVSPGDRAAFLETACNGDPALRADVEKLLGAHDRAGRFLDTPALETAVRHIAMELTGTLEGRTLGHYEVISGLGVGGMGVVYLARDIRLERQVALKFLPLSLGVDEEQRTRFLREARATSLLDHPNIGTIHEIAETPDGQMFIVMGFYEGETLKQRIERGPLPVNEAVNIAAQIAAGLAKAA